MGWQQARGEIHQGEDGADPEQEAGRGEVPQEGRRRPHRRRPRSHCVRKGTISLSFLFDFSFKKMSKKKQFFFDFPSLRFSVIWFGFFLSCPFILEVSLEDHVMIVLLGLHKSSREKEGLLCYLLLGLLSFPLLCSWWVLENIMPIL